MLVLRFTFRPMVPDGRGGTPNKLVALLVSFMALVCRRISEMVDLHFQRRWVKYAVGYGVMKVDKGPQGSHSASHVDQCHLDNRTAEIDTRKQTLMQHKHTTSIKFSPRCLKVRQTLLKIMLMKTYEYNSTAGKPCVELNCDFITSSQQTLQLPWLLGLPASRLRQTCERPL
jgi:hypothetical protein